MLRCASCRSFISALLKNDSPNHFYLRIQRKVAVSSAQSPRVPDVATTGKIKRQAISTIIYTKPIVLACCGVHRVEVSSALSLKMIHRIIFTFGYSAKSLYPRHSRLESLMSPLRVKSKGSNTIWCYCLLIWWAIRDSNPGPTGYEPVALTN